MYSAWCLGVLNSHRKFLLSYTAPVVWNLAQIVAAIKETTAPSSGAEARAASSISMALSPL